ncbi:hypothetical protein [Flavobacterium sp.]
MEEKKRHGCLTAWLIFMMIGNALSSLIYFIISPKLLEPQGIVMTKEQMILLGFLGIINLAFCVGLWYWKKWAFYGFAISGSMMFLTNLNLGTDLVSASLGLVGVLLLFSLLQMKKGEKSGWEQLE